MIPQPTVQAHVTGTAIDHEDQTHVMDANIDGEYIFAFASTTEGDTIESSCISFGSTGKYTLCAVLDKLFDMYGDKAMADAWVAVTMRRAISSMEGERP